MPLQSCSPQSLPFQPTMGCGSSLARTWEDVEAAGDLEESPTIWVGDIPSGFGHINSLGLAVVRPLTEKELVAAFSEYGEVISVSLRSKGGEFDCKSWALLTFSTAEAAGRALFGTTTVIDEAFDEVSLKVKRADIDERLGGKGQLSTIVQQQNSRVKKVEARREKKERKSEIEEERAAARRKRRERLAKENAEIDQKLDAARRKFDDGKQKAGVEPEGGGGRKSKEVLLRTAKSGEGPRQRRRSGGKVHRRRRSAETERVSAREPATCDVDRTTMWCTAWVGGLPAEFVNKGSAEMKLLRLFKKYGKVVRVTVRKKKDDGNLFKSWAFVTFRDAGAVAVRCACAARSAPCNPGSLQRFAQAAMQAEVRLEDFGCRLKVEPAAVSTELDKDSEGALRRVWQEQQQKVMADPVSEPEPGSVA